MALSYSSSVRTGDIVEREFASLCSTHNWLASKITAGFGSNIPLLVANGKKIKAPDILLRKGTIEVAVEVKSKEPFCGTYPIDIHRVDYAYEWSKVTQYPLFIVIKNKPYEEEDPKAFSVCSINKLYQNHIMTDPNSTDRNGRPCPTYIYEDSLFVPFEEHFLAGSISTKTDVSFYFDNDGEELLI